MSQDYYSTAKAPAKPCKIQVCDQDRLGPVIVKESDPTRSARRSNETRHRLCVGDSVQVITLEGKVLYSNKGVTV